MAASGKYGVVKTSEKEIPADEPVFLIRGTDPFAVPTIIEYARRCEREGAEKDHVDAAFDQAMKIAEWQRDNPEKVKGLPD